MSAIYATYQIEQLADDTVILFTVVIGEGFAFKDVEIFKGVNCYGDACKVAREFMRQSKDDGCQTQE